MKAKTYRVLSVVFVIFVTLGGIAFIAWAQGERLAATGIFILLIGGSAWRLYEGYRLAQKQRGFQNDDGSWPK
jgi:hypothetical protein